MAKKQEIVFEKDEKISKEAQDKIIDILREEKADNIEIDFSKAKIVIKAKDEKLLNDILTSIVSHFNDKQDNFSMITEGFKVDSE